MTDLDPAAVMAEHAEHVLDGLGNDECCECGHLWPCLPYRLAEALLAERERVAALEAQASFRANR